MKGQEENSNCRNKGSKTGDVYTIVFNTKKTTTMSNQSLRLALVLQSTPELQPAQRPRDTTYSSVASNSGEGDGPSSRNGKQGHERLRHALSKYMWMEVGRHNSTCWSKIQ